MEWLHEVSVLGCHVLLPAVSCTDQSSHPGVSGLLQSFTRSPTTQPYTLRPLLRITVTIPKATMTAADGSVPRELWP